AEAELLAERDGRRLLHQQRIGAAVDREAADLLTEDHAAGARRALEDDERAAAQVELVGRREPRDPAADDRRVENGGWGLGIGDWIDHGCHAVLRCNQSLITNPPQSPIPNPPQSPIPNPPSSQ